MEKRSPLPLILLLILLALLSRRVPDPPHPGEASAPKAAPDLSAPVPDPPHPGPASAPKAAPDLSAPVPKAKGASAGKPVIGGRVSPDGAVELTCDLPASERKKNIASRGLGCCVFRSGDYAAHWQQVPELYDLPEKMKKAGIAGGGYPDKVDEIFHKFAPNCEYVQSTTGDAEVLEAILKTSRMACVTYSGHDPHYGNMSIAHMVCLPCFDRQNGWACVSDNNFTGDDDFVWMSCEEFLTRWKGMGGGWVYCLLAAPPPPVPHN